MFVICEGSDKQDSQLSAGEKSRPKMKLKMLSDSGTLIIETDSTTLS